MVKQVVNVLQEFSIPLLGGVVAALLVANIAPDWYETLVYAPWCGFIQVAGDHAHSPYSLLWIVNEVFMVFFFGIAAKEITEAGLPGGALNPISKAINPILGTIGGVVGPIGVYLALNFAFGQTEWACGWGIPTATDIALAWLIGRVVFGAGHPAISFLLLLAVADDAIGLLIIALAYPDPHNPVEWIQTFWIVPGMLTACTLRFCNVRSWIPYVLIGGAFSWWGLYSAHLHPALALVPIVPFIPGPTKDIGMYKKSKDHSKDTPLEKFEHHLELPVCLGLFFFAFANAGVQFANINTLTWIVLASLIAGKTMGITLFSWIGSLCGAPLPEQIGLRQLITIGIIAGLGLTVALFVSGQAFTDTALQGSAKMGALFSASAAIFALWFYKLTAKLGVKIAK